mmetsp:Transcript_10521/g.15634  ORF Transcript_10521/g.15634 Transcript_10521/m.15634 type:complete len:107 (+) Transcript_10521:96-416(+)
MEPSLNVLEQVLSASKSGYLIDEIGQLTAADIAVASLLLYTPVFHVGEYGLLKNFRQVVDYMEFMSERPAYREAYDNERIRVIEDGIAGYRNPSKVKPKGKWGGFF